VTEGQEDPPESFNKKRFSHTRTSFVPGLRWITRNAQWKIFMVATVPLNLLGELISVIPAVFMCVPPPLWQNHAARSPGDRAVSLRRGGGLTGVSARRYISACNEDAASAPRCSQDWTSYSMMAYTAGAVLSAASLAPQLARRYGKLQTLRRFVQLAVLYSTATVVFTATGVKSKSVYLISTFVLGIAWYVPSPSAPCLRLSELS
jgi:hypothetical protein